MKLKRKALIVALALICAFCAAFALGCAQTRTYYTVTFMDGENVVLKTQVEKGKKIENYPTVEHEDEYDFLDGWCTDKELTKVWNGDIERVVKDVTLWADFLHITEDPGYAAMKEEAFSNTLTWLQRGVPANPAYSLKLKKGVKISRTAYEYTAAVSSEENPSVTIENYKGQSDIYRISWTVGEKPQGGVYGAEITYGGNTYLAGNLLYKGAGTEDNPYLVADSTDLTALVTADIPEGEYYKVLNSFTARVSSSKIAGHTFDGVLDGNGKTITVEASDCGLFYTIGENAVVTDLSVDGSIPGVSENCTGVIAGVNYGEITYCNVSATLVSELGEIGVLDGGKNKIEGGAGGIVGVNYGAVANCAFTGTIQASVGAGGIAAINNGSIENCTLGGTLGAGNSTEVGTSTKKYSYMGGIAAVNYGTVTKCSTAGSGKLLAQRSESGNSPNNDIGGIVAYNAADGVVTECWFEGIRVHGNSNIGGIAGENAGSISYCFAAATYQSGTKIRSYVGGYSNVGGIVGLSDGGTVTNCFATCNVYAYGNGAYAVAKNSVNCVYLGFNFDAREDGTISVTAPSGENNLKIAEEEAVLEATNKGYALPAGNYLELLNGGEEIFGELTGVRLLCEGFKTVITHTITVTIGEVEYPVSNTSSSVVPLGKNSAPDADEGYYLSGWSLVNKGEVVFGTKSIGYADLEELGLTEIELLGLSELNLYPVYAEGEDPYDKVLDIAVYKQYVDEDIIISLIDAFKVYCTENGIEINEFTYTMIGSSSTSVSAFCTSVSQGNYNVMFGHRANLTINTVIGSTDTKLLVDGTARRIAKLSEGTAADAFYNFVLYDDTAKKILDPSYIGEAEAQKIEITLIADGRQYGEKLSVSNATDATKTTLPTPPAEGDLSFTGWKTSDGAYFSGAVGYEDLKDFATDGKITLTAEFKNVPTIVIAYYTTSNYCTEAEAETIKAEFEEFLKTQSGITDYNVTLRAYSGNVAALVDSVILAGDVDIVLGGGTNIDTTSGTTTGQKLTLLSDKVAMPHKSARNVIRLTEKELAAEFMKYVEYINAQ